MDKSACAWCMSSTVLLVIGGINWGLIGLGTLIGAELNVINMILGGVPTIEAILYLLIGLMGVKVLVYALMGKKCCA